MSKNIKVYSIFGLVVFIILLSVQLVLLDRGTVDRELYVQGRIAESGFNTTNNIILSRAQSVLRSLPKVGEKNALNFIYYGHFEEHDEGLAVLLLVNNQTGVTIDEDLAFLLKWSHNGEQILSGNLFYYLIERNGILPDGKTAVYLLHFTDTDTIEKIKKTADVKMQLLEMEPLGFREDFIKKMTE